MTKLFANQSELSALRQGPQKGRFACYLSVDDITGSVLTFVIGRMAVLWHFVLTTSVREADIRAQKASVSHDASS